MNSEAKDDIVYDIDSVVKNAIISQRPIHISVEKNTKGYNYSVSYYGEDMTECLDTVIKAMDLLKVKYNQ